MKLVIAWLAALAVAVVMAGSCTINHKSNSFECTTQADCASDRTCIDGYCVQSGTPIDAGRDTGPIIDAPGDSLPDGGGMCPPGCTSCNQGTHTCNIDCALTGCTAEVKCPTGWACNIGCTTASSCRSGIDCTEATGCSITCSGAGSCRNLDCGEGQCKVACTGIGSCRGMDCSDSCACDITCAGGQTGASCADNSCPLGCSTGLGRCTSTAIPGCNVCP